MVTAYRGFLPGNNAPELVANIKEYFGEIPTPHNWLIRSTDKRRDCGFAAHYFYDSSYLELLQFFHKKKTAYNLDIYWKDKDGNTIGASLYTRNQCLEFLRAVCQET